MRKLLCANFARLWQDKVFWICMLAVLFCSAGNMLNGCRQATQDMSEFSYTLEHYYYMMLPALVLFIPVFTSLFLGTEYSDGTLRNKLIAGHRRTQVYLANLIVCTVASLLMLAAIFAGGLVGIPTLGAWPLGLRILLWYTAISILMTVAFSAIFTFIGMLTPNKAFSVVLSLGIAIVMLVLSSYFYNALSEPEMASGVIVTAEGGMQLSEPEPNPDYISGTRRAVYAFMADFLPTGQSITLADLAVAHPVRMLGCSLYILLGTTLYGTFLFQRRDLK